MVVLGYPTGQLGNRLFQYAHWMGNAWAYRYSLYNHSFDDYGTYFNRNKVQSIYEAKRSFLSFCIVRKLVVFFSKIVFRYLHLRQKNTVGNRWIRFYRIRDDEECDLRNSDFIRLRESTKCLVVQGWLYRDVTSFHTYADQIRDFFRVLPEHEKNIEILIHHLRDSCPPPEVVIGLHIRGGDYKDFLGGKYFYPPEQYCGVMHKVEVYFEKKKIRWLVCSNEAVDLDHFSGFDVMKGNGQIVEDMYAFAACDYIVGAPSTYTGWASFYGNKPLYYIEDIEGEIVFRKNEG